MEIFRTVREMKAWSRKLRGDGQTVGLVPTMGYLHEGHLSLVRESLGACNATVVSLFVNPAQFGPSEDLDTYPVDLENDFNLLRPLGVHAVFVPTPEEMYPDGYQTKVNVQQITRHLCGISRPDLFEGVATVVLKLFHIVQPNRAFFGEKDRQQLAVIRTMVRDLDMDIEIKGMPIIREEDGLALSSRNRYLDKEDRRAALSLNRALHEAESRIHQGERSAESLRTLMRQIIEAEPGTRIDYISVCDPSDFEEWDTVRGSTLLALAVHVGSARLIDNHLIEI